MKSFWNAFLKTSSSPSLVRLKVALATFIDLDEGFLGLGLNAIHKIVLNLSSMRLEDQLSLTTADIDSKCSTGKTPSYYGQHILETQVQSRF